MKGCVVGLPRRYHPPISVSNLILFAYLHPSFPNFPNSLHTRRGRKCKLREIDFLSKTRQAALDRGRRVRALCSLAHLGSRPKDIYFVGFHVQTMSLREKSNNPANHVKEIA